MQKIHKTAKTLVILVSLFSLQATVGMDYYQDPQFTATECSICGKKNPEKKKGVNKTTTRWHKQRGGYSLPLPSLNLSDSYSPGITPRRESPRYSPGRMGLNSIPITHVSGCSHNVCQECAELSKKFEPDSRGCRLCSYAKARIQHTQCNITGCTNSADQIKQYIKHTHGLCNNHSIQLEKLHTRECHVCYAQKKPTIFDQYPSCETCENHTDHIDANASCIHIHHLCTACKNKSDALSLDTKNCKQCAYTLACTQHTECNINTCNNPAHHITGHGTHTHGLCSDHSIEIEKLHTHGCSICYTQENPDILNQSPPCEVCKSDSDHIKVTGSCRHYLCAPCKNKSDALYPTNGCKACTYIDAQRHHVICDINECNNHVDQITGHRTHTHGLCTQHSIALTKLHCNTMGCKICFALNDFDLLNQQYCEECPGNTNTEHIDINASCSHHLCDKHHNNAAQFHYSPINYIKSRLQSNTCTTCFIKNNPNAKSCVSETLYWGEMALLASAVVVIAYGAKKVYAWWQERKEEQEVDKKDAILEKH